MIALSLYLLAVVTIALLEARTDAANIAANIPINHRDELIERAVAVGMAGLLICAAFSRWEWRTLLWVPMAWAYFTLAFRYLLNRARGKDWRYVSASNWYDRQWMLIADWKAELPSVDELKARAGTIAYAFEFAVLAASLTAYTCL